MQETIAYGTMMMTLGLVLSGIGLRAGPAEAAAFGAILLLPAHPDHCVRVGRVRSSWRGAAGDFQSHEPDRRGVRGHRFQRIRRAHGPDRDRRMGDGVRDPLRHLPRAVALA